MSFAVQIEIVKRAAEAEKEVRQVFILNRIIRRGSYYVGGLFNFGKARMVIPRYSVNAASYFSV